MIPPFPQKSLWRKSKEVIEERKILLSCKYFIFTFLICFNYLFRIHDQIGVKYKYILRAINNEIFKEGTLIIFCIKPE